MIVIVAKAPISGRCKTRLAAHCGTERARRLHQAMLTRAVARLRAQTSGPMDLVCSPSPRHPVFARLARDYGVRLRRQARGTLGRRMSHALRQTPERGSGTLLLGTDQPAIDANLIERVDQTLADGKPGLWLAPTFDGGYWAIAATHVDNRLFANCDWGTSRVARQTLNTATRIGLVRHRHPPRRDIDTWRDWQQLDRQIRSQLSRSATMPALRPRTRINPSAV